MNIHLIHVLQCPLCKSTEKVFLYYSYDVQFSKTMMKFPLVQCRDCGLAYLKERPTQECIGSFYPASFYPTHQKRLSSSDGNSLRQFLRRIVKKRLQARKSTIPDKILLNLVPSYWKVAASFPPGGRILDIGCGAGWKLDFYKDFGWETYGCDISVNAIAAAQEKGHNAVAGQIENIHYPDNYFAAIQISHVIEHLPDPVTAIKKTYKLLQNGGLLLLETPNQTGLIAKIFKRDYWQVDSPRHFQLFSKKNVLSLLINEGFEIVNMVTYNSKNGILNSMQSLITRKFGREKAYKHYLIFKLVGGLFYLATLASGPRHGENIVVFAKKQ